MGSVADLVTTGDNDPELYERHYFRHYFYCDNCGSFKLKDWIEPANHRVLTRLCTVLDVLMIVFIFLSVISGLITFGRLIYFLAVSGDLIPFYEFDIIILCLLLWAVTSYSSRKIDEKVKHLGMYCEDCGSQFRGGSAFFNNLASNPLNYTMANVPRPLMLNHWIVGKDLEEKEDPNLR